MKHRHIFWESTEISRICWRKEKTHLLFAITKLWAPDMKKNGRITWENLEDLTKSTIYRTYISNDSTRLYLVSSWGNHFLNTNFGIVDKDGEIQSERDLHITKGLLKTLQRICIDEPRISEKSESAKQLKCEQKHASGGERERERKLEKRDYIAWRFRVI